MVMHAQPNPYTNPFHIGNSDNPGNVFVSHLLTSEDNYSSWSQSMKIALQAKNKFGFLDDTVPVPEDDNPLYPSWFQNNNIVSSWILNLISKDLISNVIYSSSVAEMWRILKDQFHQPNRPRLFQLRCDLLSCPQGEPLVTAYFSKIQSPCKELQDFELA